VTILRRWRSGRGSGARSSQRSRITPSTGGISNAEDGPQDDPQGDPLHRRVQRERLAGPPRVDLGVPELAQHVAVDAHPLAVKRCQQELAAAQVRLLVEPQDGVRPDERPEDAVALPGVQHGGVAREDPLDLRRVGHHDERVEGPAVDREDVAPAAPVALEHAVLGEQHANALQRLGRRGPDGAGSSGAAVGDGSTAVDTVRGLLPRPTQRVADATARATGAP